MIPNRIAMPLPPFCPVASSAASGSSLAAGAEAEAEAEASTAPSSWPRISPPVKVSVWTLT